MKIARHVTIHGRVQGVGFRAFVEDHAMSLRLQGWVRNRREGTVEALLFGETEIVERMLDLCRTGPPGARVDRVDFRDTGEAADPDTRFAVRPTA